MKIHWCLCRRLFVVVVVINRFCPSEVPLTTLSPFNCLFLIFFLNKVFFQVLYCYSVSAIKVPSWPFSFTLWLRSFVKLSIFRVNWSCGSPRMLFSFILSALWMERSALGSGSASPHSKKHTVPSLPRAFQNAAQGLSKGSNGCQSLSTLRFIHGCQRTWWVEQ